MQDAKNRHLRTIAQLCRAISLQLRHVSTIGKKHVKQQYLRQSLSGQAPVYLADDCCLVSDSTQRSLRSADVPTCVVPQTLSSYGDRTFAAAGPRLWNSLPVQLRNPDITYGLFRRQLKGHLFREAWTLWRSVTLICGALEEHLLTYLHVPTIW